jgi:hypothetical protein
MPITKNSIGKIPVLPKEEKITKSCCQNNTGKTSCCNYFGKKIIMTLIGVLLVYGVAYIGTLVRENIKKYDYIGMTPKQERTIVVAGYGKITGGNDIALMTLGYTNTSTDVAKAQADNKKVADAILVDLKKMNIDEKDIQSSYSIYPQYDYVSGSRFAGYQVSHQMSIKIRDLTKVSGVLALASKYGANQISGLSFTVDDTENLKSQARVKALSDANKKAKVIAGYLGVNLGKAVSYSEYEGSNTYPMMKSLSATDSYGVSSAPAVSSGSSEVEMNVNIVYEIK